MIFSKLSRTLPRFSRSRKLLYSGGRSAIRNRHEELLLTAKVYSDPDRVGGGFGSLRNYHASKASLSDMNCILANPKLFRLFSSEAPNENKKNYENYFPNGKKEEPKRNEEKNESKEDANQDDKENFQETFMKMFQNLLTPLLVLGLFLSLFSSNPQDAQQISFQEFKNRILEPGLVDHIVISNKSVAKVYVRNTALNHSMDEVVHDPTNITPKSGNDGQYRYYFNIPSVDSFEEKLEEAQEALGIDPHDYVPVTYVPEMLWYHELMKVAPTLLLLGSLLFMSRKMQGGLGIPGAGGGGG